jgi:hypothetical protein
VCVCVCYDTLLLRKRLHSQKQFLYVSVQLGLLEGMFYVTGRRSFRPVLK